MDFITFCILIFFIIAGLVFWNLCKCSNSKEKTPMTVNLGNTKDLKKEIIRLKEKESEDAAIKDGQDFIKNNMDKHKFVVTLKDGSIFESEEFSASSYVCRSYFGVDSIKSYYAINKTSKQVAEDFKKEYDMDNHFVSCRGFLRVGDIEVNVNEILTKKVVKV